MQKNIKPINLIGCLLLVWLMLLGCVPAAPGETTTEPVGKQAAASQPAAAVSAISKNTFVLFGAVY